MGNESHKISRGVRLFVAFAFLGSVGLVGCHDWPDERVTAIEAQNILRQLAEIDPVKEPNIPIPTIYKLPPKKVKQIVGGAEEWKLFYFAKYHTAEKLEGIIRDQFSSKIFDAKGEKSQTVPNFAVTASPGTNQIIVRALTEQDVDAILDVIQQVDVPPIQVRIECMVSELYADLTVDRETTLLIENLFGEGVTLGGKVDASTGGIAPAFPGAALRDPAREKFGLKIGVSTGDPGHRFTALVDILVSRGYLKILMNPTLEVVNGQIAKIQAKEHVPLQQVFLRGGYGDSSFIETRTEYYDIIDSLQITPHVYADGCIGLETQAQIAAYLTPEGIKQLPIVTERTVTNKENRVRHGESLIIGGIRKTEKRDVVRGVPILKDIPILGLLFSGRDFEERAKEVIFIITPTISTNGVPNQEMVNMLRERHSSPMTQALHEQVMDPLGIKAREDEQDRQVEMARSARQESDAARTAARMEVMETSQQVETLEAELEQTKARMTQLSTKAEQAQAETQKVAAQAQEAKTQAEQAAKAKAEAEAETQKAREEAAKAKAEAEAEKAKTQKPPEQSAPPKPDAPNPDAPKSDAPKPDAPKQEAKTDKPKEGANESGPPTTPPQADATKPPAQNPG